MNNITVFSKIMLLDFYNTRFTCIIVYHVRLVLHVWIAVSTPACDTDTMQPAVADKQQAAEPPLNVDAGNLICCSPLQFSVMQHNFIC